MSTWTKLSDTQFEIFSKLLKINDDAFIIVPLKSDGIYKYKVSDNEWSKIMEFGSKPMTFHNTAYDDSNQLLYIWQDIPNDNGSLFQIDLNQKTFDTFYTNNYLGVLPPVICIDNCVHIMGLGQ
eukprot:359056_1